MTVYGGYGGISVTDAANAVANRCWFIAADDSIMPLPYAFEACAFMFAIEFVENRTPFWMANAKLLMATKCDSSTSCIRQSVKATDWKLHSLWSFTRNCVNCRATIITIPTTTAAATAAAIDSCLKNESLSLHAKRVVNNGRWDV